MFRIIPEGINYKENVFLKNGKGIFLKPATENDKGKVSDLMKRTSQDSLRMRFMASVSQVSESVINDLCGGDFTDKGCLLACENDEYNSKIIGLANYISMGNNKTAEVAFLVEDDFQGLGISTILLERLAGLASANGIVEFEAEVLPENQEMINVFKSSGFDIHKVWSSDTIHIEFPLDNPSSLFGVTNLRERIATANSLIPLLRPKSIAVIRVENDKLSIGNKIYQNILNGNFKGAVYPINKEPGTEIKIQELKEKIDLSIITVKSEEVFECARESINAGAKSIVVVSAGFSESGPEGIKRQNELFKLVRSNGVRLLGPNCLGIINSDSAVNLNASLLPQIAPQGKIGLFAHSAALGLVILNYAKSLGLGFTTFVSAGNRADVSGNDFLQYWEEDPNTKVVILYLETFGNPRKFVRIARNMSYKKPILCVKSASSITGQKTIEAKSGNVAAGVLETEALFRQTGVILAPTLEELFDTAIVLEHQPLPEGKRVGIITNSAGMLTIFADNCELNNLELDKESTFNLGAFATAKMYQDAAENLLFNDSVDSLLIGFASVDDDISDKITNSIKLAAEKLKTEKKKEKTVLLCLMGSAGIIIIPEETEKNYKTRNFPSFRFPESAVRALSRIVAYTEFKKKPQGKLIWYNDVKAENARKIVKSILEKSKLKESVINLSDEEASKIIFCFGIELNKNKEENLNIKIEVKNVPLFGPVIELQLTGTKRIVRITPLTENDLDEIFEQIKLKNTDSIKETLGRISQMIEELPWLHSLKLKIHPCEKIIVLNEMKIALNLNSNNRPTY
ncbi:MAG: hypothetical protein CR986_08210 [Ignavibacteriae bacterium]|nr:MAG: hypothetical protein CR986_08210 [Ignavibacteriota bacterium]